MPGCRRLVIHFIPTPRVPSVHDNHLYGYEFDARTSTLVLRTRFPHTTPEEFTDVWFYGVWTHHIESVLGHDILFDIENSDVANELERFGDLFTRLECHGWPKLEKLDDRLSDIVERHKLRIWHIASSYGISGFVVAYRIEKITSTECRRLFPPAQT